MTLKLNGSSSGYTAIDAPASGGNRSITFPDSDGTVALTSTAGKILKVASTPKNDTSTLTVASEAWVEAYTYSFTPSAAGSKILLFGFFSVNTNDDQIINMKIERKVASGSIANITGANAASVGSNRKLAHSGAFHTKDTFVCPLPVNYLDTPSYTLGDAITYYFYFSHGSGSSKSVYINRHHGDADSADRARYASTITAFEIG